MYSSYLVGQISTAADNLNVVVYGLLAVAALLGILTIWYWRHTKPVVPVLVERVPMPAQPVVDQQVNPNSFDPDSVWADSAPVTDKATTADDGIAFDDWLSITSPEPGHEAS